MATSYYKERYGREFTPGQGLPTVSTDLDSVRAYQFEVHFFGLPDDVTNQNDLTLAAKKITGVSMQNEAIVVDRVNDKLHYPGKTTPGDMVVTFDNLYLRETAADLWRYFKHTYDPITGEIAKSSQPGGGAGQTFKADKVEIVMLDNTLTPHSTIELYGVYPSKWEAGEFNYSTNQFHTLDVTFKYDFMNAYNYANPG
jgi:hypothetical protein